MYAVVFARQDDVQVLQEHNPTGEAEVRVRPLVDLVGEGHKDGKSKQVAVPGVDMVNLRCHEGKKKKEGSKVMEMEPYLNRFFIFFLVQTRTRAEGEEVEGHDHERNYGQHAVVSVGLNEVVSGDGRGVDVMLSEGSYEGLRGQSRSRQEREVRGPSVSERSVSEKVPRVYVTFPKTGISTEPHVSAPQWTSPDAKSAVSIPATESGMKEEEEEELPLPLKYTVYGP